MSNSGQTALLCSKELLFLNVFHDVFNLTFQNLTEHVNRMGADTFISLKSGDLPWTYVIRVDQCILCNLERLHGFPQTIIHNHTQSLPKVSIDIITEIGV